MGNPIASEKYLLSSSEGWLVDRGFMGSLARRVDQNRRNSHFAVIFAIYPHWVYGQEAMQYTDKEKRKLVNRLSRIRGQVEAMQTALEDDARCTALLQQATACRGALDGFIGTVIEHHIRQHIVDPKQQETDRAHAAEELIGVVHSYLT